MESLTKTLTGSCWPKTRCKIEWQLIIEQLHPLTSQTFLNANACMLYLGLQHSLAVTPQGRLHLLLQGSIMIHPPPFRFVAVVTKEATLCSWIVSCAASGLSAVVTTAFSRQGHTHLN